MIVVDASAVLDLLLNRPVAPSLHHRLFAPEETLHAPHLVDVEVLHVIRRYNRSREMTDDRARQAIDSHFALPLERYSHELLAERMWALRAGLTAYDAAYVALAELLRAPLITTDGRMARSPAARAVAELVSYSR